MTRVLLKHLSKEHARNKGSEEKAGSEKDGIESPVEVTRFPPHSPVQKQLTAPARLTKGGFFKD